MCIKNSLEDSTKYIERFSRLDVLFFYRCDMYNIYSYNAGVYETITTHHRHCSTIAVLKRRR